MSLQMGLSATHPSLSGRSASAATRKQVNYYAFRHMQLAPLDLDDENDDARSVNSMMDPTTAELSLPLKGPVAHNVSTSALKQKSLLPPLRTASETNNLRKSCLPPLKNGPLAIKAKYNPMLFQKSYPELREPIYFDEVGPKILHIIPIAQAQRPTTPKPSPTLDNELTGAIAITCQRNFEKGEPRLAKPPPLPTFKDPMFLANLEEKIKICSLIYDFNDNGPISADRDIKSRCLCEIVQFFENPNEVKKINEDTQEKIFEMVQKNIFDQTLIFPDPLISQGYVNVVQDTGWHHLFYCYQILNRFAQLFPESPLLNMTVIRKIFFLMNIPDNNERLQLLSFLRTYYDFHNDERPALLTLTYQQLLEYVNGMLPPYCVPPLLVFTSHMFTRLNRVFTPEILKLIRQAVFPLIMSPHIYLFGQHLQQLLTSLFTTDTMIALEFYNYLLSHWLSKSTLVMSAHIELLIYVCQKIPPEQMASMSKRTFLILSQSLLTTHLRIINATLYLWLRPKLDQWVENDSRHAVTVMYDNVKRLSEHHWSPYIRDRASQVLAEMGRLNRNAFLKMRNKNTNDSRRKRYDVEHSCMKSWAAIAKEALNFEKYDVKKKLYEIKDLFDFKKQEAAINEQFGKTSKKDSKE